MNLHASVLCPPLESILDHTENVDRERATELTWLLLMSEAKSKPQFIYYLS